jgi:dTDP-4-amino-4,6-dideoxygalactose transaminase
MDIPVVNLTLPDEVLDNARRVLASGMWVDGNEVHALEHEFAEYCGVKFCRAVSNGTTALMTIAGALGLNPGDEVIVPSFTFIATANCVKFLGAKPVFAEINPATFTIDPEDVRKKITSNTKAVLPVHLYGLCAEMPALQEICTENNLLLIEDAAQAHGSAINNQKSGSFGIANAFSLYPTKNMYSGAEGGLITTNEEELYEKIKLFMNHGQAQKYIHTALGFNFRMAEINACIARYALSQLDDWNAKRRENASYLSENLNGVGDIIVPFVPEGYTHVYHQYTIRSGQRDKIAEALKENHIGFGIHYATPVHLQPYYQSLGYEDSLPITEQICHEVISIPVHPALTEDQLAFLVQTIKNVFE